MRGSSWTAVLATIGALTFGALAQVPKGGPYGLAQTPPMGCVNLTSSCLILHHAMVHSNTTIGCPPPQPSLRPLLVSGQQRECVIWPLAFLTKRKLSVVGSVLKRP
jgi:hypothetical protein